MSAAIDGEEMEYFEVNDTGEFDTCDYGGCEEKCKVGAPGKLLCRRVVAFPDYRGDIVFQERGGYEEEETSNTLLDRLRANEKARDCVVKSEELINRFISISLLWQGLAELVGTMMIVIIGCGSVGSAVLTGAQMGIWQVAVVWSIGVALSIYATATVSGAHLNPAVSFAFAVFRRKDFKLYNLLVYTVAQFLGAFLGAAILLAFFHPQINAFLELNESSKGSGSLASIATASIFCEYFPNPGFATVIEVSLLQALCIEAFGTGILMFMILSLTDNRSKAVRNKDFAPLLIGLTVGVLISIFAPFTQAGWNPARDFGPRVLASFAGWWGDAIPGPQNGFWVYILGPYIGAFFGALFYDLTINLGLSSKSN